MSRKQKRKRKMSLMQLSKKLDKAFALDIVTAQKNIMRN